MMINQTWCDRSFEHGLFRDDLFCQYRYQTINSSFCSFDFENGVFQNYTFCRRFYSYNFTNFNQSWCNETFEDGLFNDHALCRMNFSRYDTRDFNVSWCNETYKEGIFIHHPFCYQIYKNYNLNNFKDSWCDVNYEYGIFRRHPVCNDYLRRQTERQLVFINATNSLRFNNSVYLASQYDKCGMKVNFDQDYIMFNQTIVVVYGDNHGQNNGLVEREEKDYYHFMCRRNRTIVEKLFGGGYFNTTFRKDGEREDNKTRTFDFSLTHSDMDMKRQDIYELGDFIRFRLHSKTDFKNVKAVVQQCWTTSDGYKDKKYMLIDNRCIQDRNTFWMVQNRSMSEFKVEAFRYLGANRNAIYMECHLRMCTMDDKSDECRYCDDNNVNKRRRRSTGEYTFSVDEKILVVKSPVFYIIETPTQTLPPFLTQQPGEKDTTSQSIFAGTNGTIIIALLAIVIFIALVLIVKKVMFSPPAISVATVNGLENKAISLETIKQA